MDDIKARSNKLNKRGHETFLGESLSCELGCSGGAGACYDGSHGFRWG